MSTGIVLCVGSHPVDLDDGRVLGPGEHAEGVDLEAAHNAQQIEAGHLIELKSVPTDSPRPTDTKPAQDEAQVQTQSASAASSTPAPTPAPVAPGTGGSP